MRYSTQSRERKYIKGYGFLSIARKFGDKYGKKLMGTATKTGMDAAKTASKGVVQKLAEATAQWAFTCSKLTIEILEQGVKYVQS